MIFNDYATIKKMYVHINEAHFISRKVHIEIMKSIDKGKRF